MAGNGGALCSSLSQQQLLALKIRTALQFNLVNSFGIFGNRVCSSYVLSVLPRLAWPWQQWTPLDHGGNHNMLDLKLSEHQISID